jgi:hypothetical protein
MWGARCLCDADLDCPQKLDEGLDVPIVEGICELGRCWYPSELQ